MVICCVPKCKSRSGATVGVKFYELPSNEIRQQWITNISRANWTPTDSSKVCSLHFEESCFKIGLQRRLLKKEAIPTIFNDFPKYMQHSIQSKSRKRKEPVDRHTGPVIPKRGSTNSDLDSSQWQVNAYKSLVLDASTPTQSAKTNEVNKMHHSTSVWGKFLSPTKTKKKLKSSTAQVTSLRRKLSILTKENQYLKSYLKEVKNSLNYDLINESVDKGEKAGWFIKEQLQSFGKLRCKWSEQMVRQCIIWRAKSPKSYEHARSVGLIRLPSNSTLKRYAGPICLEAGLTTTIRQRLEEEVKILAPIERTCSLIFDEMSIKPMVKYVQYADRIVGYKTYGRLFTPKTRAVANKLLCFLLKGLSTNYRIPVSYFFTKQLEADELEKLIRQVIIQIEGIGFKIIRLVCDDLPVNVKAYKLLSRSDNLVHKMPHIIDHSRVLFLSFDYCHIIKNIRNMLLEDKKLLKINGELISGNFIKMIYEIDKEKPVKLVRTLNRKTVYPNNFEKMNVRRAVRVFSNEVQAAIELLRQEGLEDFTNSQATVVFIQNMRRWFEIHDVSNRTHHIVSRNANKQHFWLINDERLNWLENYFMNYLDSWKTSCLNPTIPGKVRKRTVGYLTKETDEALRNTTRATVDCVRYLLNSGFHFVLTRNFSSDDLESTFSSVRQLCGSNDQTDILSVTYALEKILKTGLMSVAKDSNVATKNSSQLAICSTSTHITTGDERDSSTIPSYVKAVAIRVKFPPSITTLTPNLAGHSMIAGFCVRLVKDRFICKNGVDHIIDTNRTSILNTFVSLQDRGGLMYPSQGFLELVVSILNFLEDTLTITLHWSKVTETLLGILLPCIKDSKVLRCGCNDQQHNLELQHLAIKHLLKIFFTNVAMTKSDAEDKKGTLEFKPLSRKVLKL